MTSTVVSGGGVRIRIGPWRGLSEVAEVAALPPGAHPSGSLLHAALDRAVAEGFRQMVTVALPRVEWRPYLDAGFTLHEELHLLSHALLDLPARTGPALRRAQRRDRARVLALDGIAFPDFWRLDATGLDEALQATPASRFRVDRAPEPMGYAIIGRAGDRGYVQRLAVAPEAQSSGLGSALVIDGLWWLRRWRVREALVNTQVDNFRALALYERLGFRRRIDGLGVLSADLGPRR